MFHKSGFGQFGINLPRDLNGYVPQEGDKAESFNFGHDDYTADFDANGDGYVGCAAESWENMIEMATKQTAKAEANLQAWREENP